MLIKFLYLNIVTKFLTLKVKLNVNVSNVFTTALQCSEDVKIKRPLSKLLTRSLIERSWTGGQAKIQPTCGVTNLWSISAWFTDKKDHPL